MGVVAQLTKDRQLDPGFGVSDEETFPVCNDFGAPGAAQAVNKVLALAGAPGSPWATPHNLILTRYNPDGALDTSFVQTGTLAFSLSANPDAY